MGTLQTIGIFSGCLSLFFALVTALMYFKLKKFLSLISEDQLEKAMPIYEKQRRKTYAYLIISCVFTVITLVLSFVNNM